MSEASGQINRLIEVCKDSAAGFREAAKHLEKPEYRDMFVQIADERERFANELQALVASIGGQPQTQGTARAAVHRVWMNLRSAISAATTKAILDEAERGEAIAVNVYEEVSKAALTPQAREVVKRQFTAVKQAHDRVKALRDIQSL